jgi:beta-lactam-binding protein with PASTA domain
MKIKLNKGPAQGILIAAGVFIGGMLILLVFADTIVMPIFTRQGSEVEVPNVIDLSLQAAQAQLREADLDAAIGGEEYDPQRPKGTVILQIPEGGSMVKSGRKVTLTISKGSASATVPEMEGFTLREARMMLEREGLVPGEIIWHTDPDLPDGVIINSVPPAGAVMRLNADVQLIVNRIETEMMVRVPNFVGLDLDEARALAQDNYLLIGNINYAVDQDLLPETVKAQSVAPGHDVKKWSAVDLTVTALE